jgi:hypothetical protein
MKGKETPNTEQRTSNAEFTSALGTVPVRRSGFDIGCSIFSFPLRLVRARFFSPPGLLLRAALIAAVFAIVHFAGWREHTTFLSGTPAATTGNAYQTALLGTIYIATYLSFVLLCPILILASGLLWVWKKRSRGTGVGTSAATY